MPFATRTSDWTISSMEAGVTALGLCHSLTPTERRLTDNPGSSQSVDFL